MPNLIKLLPDNVSNQIAAGEVVQRPSSVVKELLENSIDAKSTSIKLITKDGGKSLIQIVDNGLGMSEIDARMCFEKHATSKITSAHELFALHTMGFRGEALASIASIAQVELETCDDDSGIGTKVTIEASRIKNQIATASHKGTKISVKNLFFNIPARRNFLKSNTIENKHIIDDFVRIVLAHPDIEFSLYQDEKNIYQLHSEKVGQRIVHIFGENYKNQLIPCNQTTDLVTISGYIGKPEFAKKTRGDQHLYVNKRFIKSNQLNHAIRQAYERLLHTDSFPFYSIFIEIAPSLIDVNVHPSKTEVKFADDNMIYSMLQTVVKRALSVYQISPSIDFSQETTFDILRPLNNYKSRSMTYKESNYARLKGNKTTENFRASWDELIGKVEKNDPASEEEILKSSINNIEENECSAKDFDKEKVVQLFAKYILLQTKNYLLLLDQNAAHKRILFEGFLKSLQEGGVKMQSLLFPTRLSFASADMKILEENMQAIKSLGFDIHEFGQKDMIINACPAEVKDMDLQKLMEEIIESLKWSKTSIKLNQNETVAWASAASAAIKSGKFLGKEEMQSLVDHLFACKNPSYTPDGQRTHVTLSSEDIEDLFHD